MRRSTAGKSPLRVHLRKSFKVEGTSGKRQEPTRRHGVNVEATRAIRQAEVGAARTTIDRTKACFGLKPRRLSGDSACGES
jgi:hypothetical protein